MRSLSEQIEALEQLASISSMLKDVGSVLRCPSRISPMAPSQIAHRHLEVIAETLA
ncbi:MAG: hypothetical protein ING80_01965 [Rhodocyclaceae bacterium]|nr:hypothetical protein [Rhodocyclaceae bacterium]